MSHGPLQCAGGSFVKSSPTDSIPCRKHGPRKINVVAKLMVFGPITLNRQDHEN